jgi:hypothetical protein
MSLIRKPPQLQPVNTKVLGEGANAEGAHPQFPQVRMLSLSFPGFLVLELERYHARSLSLYNDYRSWAYLS